MRKQPVAAYSPWDFEREPGDRVYERRGAYAFIYDLLESTGRNKRLVGELTPRLVMKNGKARLAVYDGKWHWKD